MKISKLGRGSEKPLLEADTLQEKEDMSLKQLQQLRPPAL